MNKLENEEEYNPKLWVCPICNKHEIAFNAKICPGCGGDIDAYMAPQYPPDNSGNIGCLVILIWIGLSCAIAFLFGDSYWAPLLSAALIALVFFLYKKEKKIENEKTRSA